MKPRNLYQSSVWLLLILLLAAGEMAFAQLKTAAAPANPANPVITQPRNNAPAGTASTPVADYQFAGALSSRVAGAPELTETGAGSSLALSRLMACRVRYVFDAGNGLRLDAADALISDSVFSIQMAVRLSDLTGGGTNFVKLIDFGDLAMISVSTWSTATTRRRSRSSTAPGSHSGTARCIPDNDWVQVVLTRDSNNNHYRLCGRRAAIHARRCCGRYRCQRPAGVSR